MDDFVIPTKTEEELEKHTIRFLKIAEKHNLCFKQSKCNCNTTEIPILGVWVGNGEVQMEEEKVKAIKEWKTPTKVKDVKSFLGFCKLLSMIHQGFQPHYSTIKSTKRKRRIEMDKRRTKCIRKVETKDNHTTSTGPTQKRRKIQGRSRRIRTHNWRSSFTRTRRQMETSCFPIKNNVTCGKELRNI